MISLSTLTAGGLAAAAIAAWGHIRSSLSYISSAAIVKATIGSDHDSSGSRAVRKYLKRNFKVVPGGSIDIEAVTFVPRQKPVLVPFLRSPSTTVFYRGSQVIVANQKSYYQIQLTFLRGTVNIKELVKAAILEEQSHNHTLHERRHFVRDIMGIEKGFSSAGNQRKDSRDELSTSSPDSSQDSNAFPRDWPLDSSFMYPNRDDYSPSLTDDPFKNLFYEEEVFGHIQRALKWKENAQWYQDRCIPWRMGWLLHGPGGTGKSSLFLALSKKMDFPIFRFHLSTMSDQEFISHWNALSENKPCMVLFEDFDNVFHLREPLTPHKLLSFDTVLNSISGITDCSGIFLGITTNKIDDIDPAMGVTWDKESGISTRPGRIDSVLYLGYISRENRIGMASVILADWPEERDRLINDPREVTPNQFQAMCVDSAWKMIGLNQ